MATSRVPAPWYDSTHIYIVHGGPVESRTDGQVHHIPALQVAHLYGLRAGMHNVVLVSNMQEAIRHRQQQRDRATSGYMIEPVIHLLGPRSDGDYSIPEDVQTYLSTRRVLRDGGSGGFGPGPHSVRIENTATGESEYVQATRLAFASLVRNGAGGADSAAETLRRFADVVRGVARAVPAVPVSGLEVEATRTNPSRYAPTPVSVETAQAWVKASTVPEEGSRAWIRIVKKGCVGERGISGDFDCNDYAWGCDYCPVVVDRMNRESALEKSIKGNRMHRFWRAKAKAKNEIDCKSSTMVGIDPAYPGSDRTVVFVGGRRTGLNTIAKRYRKG